MTNEQIADAILRFFAENPIAYHAEDKWPAIAALIFLYSLPIIFGLLLIFPFFWIWHTKKKFTLKNLGKAFLQSVALIVTGIVILFLLFSFMLGQIAQEIN